MIPADCRGFSHLSFLACVQSLSRTNHKPTKTQMRSKQHVTVQYTGALAALPLDNCLGITDLIWTVLSWRKLYNLVTFFFGVINLLYIYTSSMSVKWSLFILSRASPWSLIHVNYWNRSDGSLFCQSKVILKNLNQFSFLFPPYSYYCWNLKIHYNT